jgi:hypothetical protein
MGNSILASQINILFDDRRYERYHPLMEELERQGIENFRFWPAILKGNVVESINAGFKQIIQWAKDEGLKEVIICEDDVYFPAADGFEYFLKRKPKSFDIYIAGSYLKDNRIIYESPITKVNAYVGNHLIIVHERYYDTFLSVPDNEHVDVAQSDLGEFYLCYPMAALQRKGFSSNNKICCDYNELLNKEDIYGN